jgi:hypothetical protein
VAHNEDLAFRLGELMPDEAGLSEMRLSAAWRSSLTVTWPMRRVEKGATLLHRNTVLAGLYTFACLNGQAGT